MTWEKAEPTFFFQTGCWCSAEGRTSTRAVAQRGAICVVLRSDRGRVGWRKGSCDVSMGVCEAATVHAERVRRDSCACTPRPQIVEHCRELRRRRCWCFNEGCVCETVDAQMRKRKTKTCLIVCRSAYNLKCEYRNVCMHKCRPVRAYRVMSFHVCRFMSYPVCHVSAWMDMF